MYFSISFYLFYLFSPFPYFAGLIPTVLVGLDITTSFDLIIHVTLLQRLESEFIVCSRVLSWLHSYLSGHIKLIKQTHTTFISLYAVFIRLSSFILVRTHPTHQTNSHNIHLRVCCVYPSVFIHTCQDTSNSSNKLTRHSSPCMLCLSVCLHSYLSGHIQLIKQTHTTFISVYAVFIHLSSFVLVRTHPTH